jgi:paraquat-inducible protein A
MNESLDVAGLTARSLGVIECPLCGLLNRTSDLGQPVCCRCATALEARKPDSLARTWAYLLAAAILYVPANLYPVLRTQTIAGSEADTILQGVVLLWRSRSWLLAVLVFFASIMVPLIKLLALTLLLVSIHRRTSWHLLERARLFRLLEWVGRWSMLDIFVVAILVALVHLRALATVEAGPGALAFGAVVVLTMLAAQAFDPRLLWDGAGRNG